MAKSRANGAGSVVAYRDGYRLRWTMPDGTRKSLVLKGVTKKEANARLASILTDIERHEFYDERAGKIAFGVVAREHIRLAEIRESTRTVYRSLLRTVLAPFDGVPIGSITVQSVERWWRENDNHPVNRRNGYFLMRAVMKSAMRWSYIKTSPCIIDGAGKDVAKSRPTWTVDHYEKVLQHLDEGFVPAVEMMYSAHLRIGETVGLNASDYNPLTGRVSVTKQGRGEETKTRQHKHIRILDPGPEIMAAYLAEHPRIGNAPLFTGPKGGRLPRATLRKAWIGACERAGIENFHLHDLRHIGGTEIARVVKNPKDIQARLGHASLTSSMRYLHTDEERDAEVASLASARRARRTG